MLLVKTSLLFILDQVPKALFVSQLIGILQKVSFLDLYVSGGQKHFKEVDRCCVVIGFVYLLMILLYTRVQFDCIVIYNKIVCAIQLVPAFSS